MSRTSRGTSLLSGTFGRFQSTPRKINKSTARKNGGRVLAKKKGRNGQIRVNPYQSAEIEFDPACACDAVKKIKGRRFLVRDVPSIPMPDCDSPDCQCSYVRYKDRRLWVEDRRAFYSLSTGLYRKGDDEDRRKRKERRVSAESRERGPSVLDDFESWFK